MEYIIELNQNHQLTLPEAIIEGFELKPGSHFTLRSKGGRLLIEYLPFSSFEQSQRLEETISSLKKNIYD